MGNEKKNVMFLVANLKLGGQQKICIKSAELLTERYNVYLAVIDASDAFYESSLPIIDLQLGPQGTGLVQKVVIELKRIKEIRKLKKKYHIDVTYSFGDTANIVNTFSRWKDTVLVGVRAYRSLENHFFVKCVLPFADKVVCISNELAIEARNVVRNKNMVALENFVDCDSIVEKAKEQASLEYEDAFYVVAVGRVVDVKGYWHLIKAINLVHQIHPDVKLIHIGGGDVSEYEKLADKSGIKDKIVFMGEMKNPFKEMKNADVFVLSSCNEGFANVITEAMCLGLPIVSTNCKVGPAGILHDNLEEAIEKREEIYLAEYGILVPEVNGEKNMDETIIEECDKTLAEGIMMMMEDEKLREHYKRKSKERIRNYSVETYKDNLISCIEK